MEAKRSPKNAKSNTAIFMVAVLDMSWRLALAVLVPIVGGFEIDKHLNTSPVFIIIGFLVAMAGTFLIMRQIVADADNRFKPTEGRK